MRIGWWNSTNLWVISAIASSRVMFNLRSLAAAELCRSHPRWNSSPALPFRNVVQQNRFAHAAGRLVRIQPGESEVLTPALLGRHPTVVFQHGLADGNPSGDRLVGFQAVPGRQAEPRIVTGVEAFHVEVRDAAPLQLRGEARHVL